MINEMIKTSRLEGKINTKDISDVYHTFSFDLEPQYKIEDQIPCHLTYTTKETHDIIRKNLH